MGTHQAKFRAVKDFDELVIGNVGRAREAGDDGRKTIENADEQLVRTKDGEQVRVGEARRANNGSRGRH